VHEFDAWAAAFGDTSTELELQPSGAYKPVTRFAAFINVADLMMMFRSIADVVQKTDLRGLLTLPRIRTGQRQLVTAEASPDFKDYQRNLAQRIEAIEARSGRCRRAMTSCWPSSPTAGMPRSTCGWSGTEVTMSRRTSSTS
jgi:N12 class adenine-specific DNA methylase